MQNNSMQIESGLAEHFQIMWGQKYVGLFHLQMSPRNMHFGSWKFLCYAKRVLVETDSYVLYVSTYIIGTYKVPYMK